MDDKDLIKIVPAEEEKEAVAAAELINQLRKGKKIHDQFAKQFRTQYLIAGKTISDWKAHFKVNLPPDLNPGRAQAVDTRLMELHPEATFYKAEAEARLSAYKSANDKRYREEFTALVTEYKKKGEKLPAKDTLASLANEAISEVMDGLTHAEIESNFWTEVLDDLRNSRRLLDNATISMSVEAKVHSQEAYLNHLCNKKDGD
jgi:hypothetical protein